MKKHNIGKKLLSIGAILFLGLGLSNSLQNSKLILETQQKDDIKVLSLSPDVIGNDVESLDISVNLTNQLFNYDITFKNHNFDGQNIHSFFFYKIDPSKPTEWDKWNLKNGETSIADKHATNSGSYEDLFDEDLNLITYDSRSKGIIQFGIEYGTEEHYATKSTIDLEIKSLNPLEPGEEDKNPLYLLPTEDFSLKLNDEKTFAQVNFFINYDVNRLEFNNVHLKSHANSEIDINLFQKSDILIQGNNSFSIQLEEDYHYSDLFLQFTFKDRKSNESGVKYFITGDFNESIDFQSGIPIKAKWEWGTKEIITFSFVIFFIIIVLILFFIILFQINKRKRLEKEQAKEYYNQNLS